MNVATQLVEKMEKNKANGWQLRRLDELGFVGRGKSRHRPRNDARLYGGPYPLIQTADIMAANPYINGYSQTYSEFGLGQSKLWPAETLCITIAGANTAKTAILRFEACFPDSVVGFIPIPEKAEIYFVKYSLDLMRNDFLAVSRGATQDNLSLDKLLSFPLRVPDINEQKRIGGVIKVYDELIENNQRRIKILETMARNLYREWFVHFRFPGHEKVRMISSPLGQIPEEWSVNVVAEVAQTFRGRSYRSENLAESGGLPFLNLKCLDRDGGFRRSGLKRYVGEYKEGHIARKGDIVMAVTDMTQDRAIIARAAFVPTLDGDFGICSMDLVRIEPKSAIPKAYLYSFLRFSGFADEVKQHANGANVLHLSPERITAFQFVVPPVELMVRFAAFVTPVFEQMNSLENQIDNLRHTRDLLLPRLLSAQFQCAE